MNIIEQWAREIREDRIQDYMSFDLDVLKRLIETNKQCINWIDTHPRETVEGYIAWRDKQGLISDKQILFSQSLETTRQQCNDAIKLILEAMARSRSR